MREIFLPALLLPALLVAGSISRYVLSQASGMPGQAPSLKVTLEERLLFQSLNRLRLGKGVAALEWDPLSHQALRELEVDWSKGLPSAWNRIFERVWTKRSHELHSRAGLLPLDQENRLDTGRLPSHLLEKRFTHGSVAVVEDLEAAVAAFYLFEIPPRLGARYAKGPPGNYLFRCPACDKEALVNLSKDMFGPGGFRVACGYCRTIGVFYLDDTEGVNHWPTWFPQPYAPEPAGNPFLAWRWANERIRYDYRKARHDLPGWQTPRQTHQWASGVCRDTAVLLCAWLREMGLDARVVLGVMEGEDEHDAWVVLFSGERAYLLETTFDGDMSRRYPPRLDLATGYYPTKMMFNDRHVWVKRGQSRARDYLSSREWVEVKETP